MKYFSDYNYSPISACIEIIHAQNNLLIIWLFHKASKHFPVTTTHPIEHHGVEKFSAVGMQIKNLVKMIGFLGCL